LQDLAQHAFAEVVAAALREALDALGEILGQSTRAELLDLIFSRFCIGK
jgi:tRNA modification GTPase